MPTLPNCIPMPTVALIFCSTFVAAAGWTAGAVPLMESASSIPSSATFQSNAGPHHAQGEMAGEVTATSVLLQSRLTAITGPELDAESDIPGQSGIACFEIDLNPNFPNPQRTEWMTAIEDNDFIVRSQVTNLQPGTRYFYRLVLGPDRDNLQFGTACRFKTLPGPTDHQQVTFCMGSCMNYHAFMSGVANGGGPITATAEDKRLGYPAFVAMQSLNPDFFVGTGDIVYYDHPAKSAATSLPELHRKWHEQFRLPRLIQFFSQTPGYWSKDDHDFRFNDADLRGNKLPDAATGIQLFRQQMPIHPLNDKQSPTYRTHRINADLQLWFVEGRDFRSANRDPDGPEKTIWGNDQKQWLMTTLKQSDATWKIIVTPTPLVGPDSGRKKDNHTNIGGFRHEAQQFFDWLQSESLTNVISFCGDRHWQYHSIHPQGVEEFCCGALNDENSIRGSRPGAGNSTDPQGLIRQPYVYSEPTGGFLHVIVSRESAGTPQLVIEHRDDHGKILNTVIRTTGSKD